MSVRNQPAKRRSITQAILGIGHRRNSSGSSVSSAEPKLQNGDIFYQTVRTHPSIPCLVPEVSVTFLSAAELMTLTGTSRKRSVQLYASSAVTDDRTSPIPTSALEDTRERCRTQQI